MFFLEAGSWIAGLQEDDKGADWGDFRQVRQQWGRQDEQGGVQAAYGIEKELNMTPNIQIFPLLIILSLKFDNQGQNG